MGVLEACGNTRPSACGAASRGRSRGPPRRGPRAAGVRGTFIVTNTADSGAGSLRQAIIDSSTASGSEIDFAIGTGVQRITLASPLPVITSPVVHQRPDPAGRQSSRHRARRQPVLRSVRALRRPGRPAGGSTIEGLAVVGFAGRGVVFDGRRRGSAATPSSRPSSAGIRAAPPSTGTSTPGWRSSRARTTTSGAAAPLGAWSIGGNGGEGSLTELQITGTGSSGNTVAGNWIGLGADGTTPRTPSTGSSSRAAHTTTRSAASTPSATPCTPSARMPSTSGTQAAERRRRQLDRPRRQRCA